MSTVEDLVQFLKPDIGHAVMHRLWGWLGHLNLDGAKS